MDVGTGKFNSVAKSPEEFRELLTDKKFVADYLAVQIVGDLIQNDIVLKEGEIYSFIELPILGGEYIIR